MAPVKKTLQVRMTEAPLSVAAAKCIASEIAEALETAHQKGLVHGDLEPSNIVLTSDDHVKLLDKGGESDEDDPRADILSLGQILQEMLAGNPDVSELLEHILRKMLATRPEDRYQLVHEVRTDLDHVDVEASVPESGSWRLSLGLVALVALAVVAIIGWWPRPSPGTLSGGDLSSVAVLPLNNISADPLESDYIAEGISQAVVAKLVQVGLRVTPWETARRYADSDERIESIARELNVDAVLSGNFQLSGERIVATLTLVEAESGFATWAGDFEEPYEDLFVMQRKIAVGVASSLKRELTGEEEKTLATPESSSVDAYDFYLQGSHMMQEGTEEATNIAFEYFTRAVELDPTLEEAHVGLGTVYTTRYWFGWEGGSQNLGWAEASYERALELNPALMTARRGLVHVNFYRGRSEACLVHWREAARYGRASDLETLLTRALAYHFGGLTERSLPLFRRVLEIDPGNQEAHFHLGIAYFWIGEFEEAIAIGNASIRRFGDDPEVHTNVAASYYLLGNHERAREHYEKVAESGSRSSATYPLVWAGHFFDQIGEREQAEAVWRIGVELLEPTLESYPDHAEKRLYLATLYGLLGEPRSLAKEEQRALDAVDYDIVGIYNLAAAHARLGDTPRAVELLRRSVRDGRFAPVWTRIFEMASPTSLESDMFDPFLEEYEAEVRRLRETY